MGLFDRQVKKFKEALEAVFKLMPSGHAREEEVNVMAWAEQYVLVKVSLLSNFMILLLMCSCRGTWTSSKDEFWRFSRMSLSHRRSRNATISSLWF